MTETKERPAWMAKVQYLMNEYFNVDQVDATVMTTHSLLDSLPKEPGPVDAEYGCSRCVMVVTEASGQPSEYDALLQYVGEELRIWGRVLSVQLCREQLPDGVERALVSLPSVAERIPTSGNRTIDAIHSQHLKSPRQVWLSPHTWLGVDAKVSQATNETEDWGYDVKHVELSDGTMLQVGADPLVSPTRAIYLCGDEESVWIEHKPGPIIVCRAELGDDFIRFVWEAHWRVCTKPGAVAVQELPS